MSQTDNHQTTIGELTVAQSKEEPASPSTPPTTLVIGAATMGRLSYAVINDPNLASIILATIEAAGGDPSKQWRLHLKGVLVLVQP